MKKTLISLSVAGALLATAMHVGLAHAVAPLKVITSDMGGKGATSATATIEVAADKSVSVMLVDSTGNAAADARIERLVARSVDPDVALTKVPAGQGVRYSSVPMTIRYVAAGGCVAPMSSTAADIIDPTVVCSPLARSGSRSGGSEE